MREWLIVAVETLQHQCSVFPEGSLRFQLICHARLPAEPLAIARLSPASCLALFRLSPKEKDIDRRTLATERCTGMGIILRDLSCQRCVDVWEQAHASGAGYCNRCSASSCCGPDIVNSANSRGHGQRVSATRCYTSAAFASTVGSVGRFEIVRVVRCASLLQSQARLPTRAVPRDRIENAHVLRRVAVMRKCCRSLHSLRRRVCFEQDSEMLSVMSREACRLA